MNSRADPSSWRLRLMVVIAIGLGALLVARLVQLQILEHSTYEDAAREIHVASERIQGPRGAILDRNGLPLVTGIDTFEVHIDREPWELDEANERLAVERLAELLGVGPDAVRRIAGSGPSRDTLLATHLPYALGEAIIAEGLPGVRVAASGLRLHTEGALASQLLGFVGRGNVGLSGIEYEYDSLLRGRSGRVVYERDSVGNPIPFGVQTIEPVQPGADLVLTIDRNLQRMAEEHLATALEETGAEGGTILMLDPHTGDILAMASAPTFDVTELDLNAQDLDLSLFRNRAVTDVYEPGSVFKVITMGAALDIRVVTPDSTFNDTGAIVIGTRTIRNFDLSYHGEQTMTQVLQRSLNTGSVWVAQQLGPTAFYRYVHAFGFGESTRSGLSGEAPGLLKEPGNLFWSEVDLGTNSYGQGISVTPIQIVRAIAAIANGGELVRPRILRAVITPDGVRELAPVSEGQVIREETAASLRLMMQAVVDGVLGHPAQTPGWPVAGKSGTSDVVEGGRYLEGAAIASFAGFAPADDPRIVVLIKLDRPQGEIFGGVIAAPVFSAVLRDVLPYLGVPATDYVAEPSVFDPPPQAAGGGDEPPEGEVEAGEAEAGEAETDEAGTDEAGTDEAGTDEAESSEGEAAPQDPTASETEVEPSGDSEAAGTAEG